MRKLFFCLLLLLFMMNSPAFARENDLKQEPVPQGKVHHERQANQEDEKDKDRQMREQGDKDKRIQEEQQERQRRLEEQQRHDKSRQEKEQEDRRLREQREYDRQVRAEQEHERQLRAQQERERQLHERNERERLERERREALERERKHREQEEKERRQEIQRQHERYWRDGHYDWSHHETYRHKNWHWIERPFERRLPFAWHDSLTEHTLRHYLEALEDHEWYNRFPGLYPYRWHDRYGNGFWYRDRYVSDAILFYNEEQQLVSVGFMRDGVFIMLRDDDQDYENRDFFFFSWWDQNIKIKMKL